MSHVGKVSNKVEASEERPKFSKKKTQEKV